MTNFYNLTNHHQLLLSRLYDLETGEVDESVEAQLNALSSTIQDKCVSVAGWIKKLEADRRQVVEMYNELSIREQAYNKEIKRIEEYLKKGMEQNNITEVSCPFFTVKLKKNPLSTTIVNEYEIPIEFIKTTETVKVEERPDKEAIKEHFTMTGEQVSGTIVRQTNRIEISTTKI